MLKEIIFHPPEKLEGAEDFLTEINENFDSESKKEFNKLEISLFVSIGSNPTKISFKKENERFYTLYAFEGNIEGYSPKNRQITHYKKNYRILTFQNSEKY
ncbi:hypothetical protein COU58_01355 [Candidatus Pacearchaeota archaeon CG10_big_fil_rev_8_21_14_0_10_32_42]|nr:MAG: hypothetical protein COU58_01355 [Candidatus Pacearchaeota archaeon CG10_big_fil_rev_8_21_14_0_10_32_42]